jgi:DNA primase
MGSQLSKPQEELIVKSLHEDDHILVMLDEDEAGRIGREQVLQRLATRAFVKVFQFPKEGQQPTDLSGDELRELIGGAE